MSLRLVMRWVGLGTPYSWFGFATRFAAGDIVGDDFFRRFAQRVHATFHGQGTDTGLMESLDLLRWAQFNPDRVHPLIREFYEHTSRFDMAIEIQWNPLVRPFGALYLALVGRAMQQLQVPLNSEGFEGLDNWLEVIDLEGDSKPDFRCWIRVLRDSHIPVYVGAYKTYRSGLDNEQRAYVSVAFPVPGGTITTVLTPLNLDPNGLHLTTNAPGSTENGVYWLIPHRRSFSMAPAFGLSEQFRLRPSPDDSKVLVTHDCYWLGIRAFTMYYTISPMRPRSQASIQSLLSRA